MTTEADLLIRGGRVVDPANGVDEVADLWVVDGCVAGVGRFDGTARRSLDATGLVVAPGFVDMHVHLREPGQEWKEDIESGSRAAVAGGVTTLCCMPNTQPRLDHAGVLRQVLARASEVGLCRLHPIAAVSRNLEGKQLTEMRELHRVGAVAFSDDGVPIWHAGLMRRALEYAASFGFLIIQHAEEPNLTAGGCINEGWVSTRLGVTGMPSEGEESMVARDIMLCRRTGGRYHVAHISTAHSVDLVRRARAEGLPVSAEAAPHHFDLTEEALLDYNADAKMNPPLRTEVDRQAVIDGLRDGTIEVIATDHAPHHVDDKRCGLGCAAFGIVGLETLLPISLKLVRDGVLPLSGLIAKMTCNPARLLGLACGTLGVGAEADVCIFDPEEEWVLDRDRLRSKSSNTPWHGATMVGRVRHTLLRGRVVYGGGDAPE